MVRGNRTHDGAQLVAERPPRRCSGLHDREAPEGGSRESEECTHDGFDRSGRAGARTAAGSDATASGCMAGAARAAAGLAGAADRPDELGPPADAAGSGGRDRLCRFRRPARCVHPGRDPAGDRRVDPGRDRRRRVAHLGHARLWLARGSRRDQPRAVGRVLHLHVDADAGFARRPTARPHGAELGGRQLRSLSTRLRSGGRCWRGPVPSPRWAATGSAWVHSSRCSFSPGTSTWHGARRPIRSGRGSTTSTSTPWSSRPRCSNPESCPVHGRDPRGRPSRAGRHHDAWPSAVARRGSARSLSTGRPQPPVVRGRNASRATQLRG